MLNEHVGLMPNPHSCIALKRKQTNDELTVFAGDNKAVIEGFWKSLPRFFVVDWLGLGGMFSVSSPGCTESLPLSSPIIFTKQQEIST